MAASKLKNKRRFITRDVRLDIPEDQELNISPMDDASSQHDSPYNFTANTSFCDRTWPRRTWRPTSDFAKPFGLQQNSVLSSTLTLPRFHHGVHESQSALAPSGHCGLQSQPPGDWRGNDNASPTSSSSDPRWRFQSLSDVVSSNCLSSVSSPSETASEPCFKTNCHDSTVYGAGSLSSRNSNVSSPRDHATTFALGSIPELVDDYDVDDTSISGLETKRRSYSLNESSSYRPSFFNHLRTNRSPQPGSVLHRALTWEMAGRSQPFRVTVSPSSDSKGQENGFRRNASTDRLHDLQPQLGFDPSNIRSSSSVWKSVGPAAKSWTKQEKEGVGVIDQTKVNRLLSLSTGLKDSRDQLRAEQTTWNSASAGKQSELAREVACRNLINGFELGRLEQNPATGGDSNGFRTMEFRVAARASPVKTSRSFSDSTQRRKEIDNIFVGPPNTFRESLADDLDSSKDCSRVRLAEKTFRSELYRDNDNSNAPYNDFLDQTVSSSRKPFRSKSMKLLSSEVSSFSLGRDSGFLRPLSDWKTDTISLSTPNSPLSQPEEVDTAPKHPVTHSFTQPSLSMIALNTGSEDHSIRPNSITRSEISLLSNSNAVPQKTNLSTWGPFVVADLRKAITKPVSSTAISEQTKPHSIKPFGSNFVVRRITNLAKNPFNSISSIGENINIGNKSSQPLPSTGTRNDENAAILKPSELVKFEEGDRAGQNPKLTRLDLDKSRQDTAEVPLAYNGHDTFARNQNHRVPWSGIPTWNGTPNKTKLDDGSSPSNPRDSLISSKDSGYERSATESSPSVTSERLTVHLTGPVDPSPVDEDRASDRCNDGSMHALTRNSNSNNCSRHIRVFLKSSSQLQDEAFKMEPCSLHIDTAIAEAPCGIQDIDEKWKKEISNMQLDRNPSGVHWVEAGHETDGKAKDLATAKNSARETDSAKANDSAKAKDSAQKTDWAKANYSTKAKDSTQKTDWAKANDSPRLAAESSPKATHPEHWHHKARVKTSPPLLNNDGSCFKDQQKPNEETRLPDLGMNTLSTARPVATSSCLIEIKSADPGLKKPFEIVKKKLIIPEALSWLSSREDKSKPRLKQGLPSQEEQDLYTRNGQDVRESRSEERQADAASLTSAFPKETNAYSKGFVLDTDTIEHKSNRSVVAGTTYIASGPSQTDIMTSCDRHTQSKRDALENISIIPPNQSFTLDTGISILCEDIMHSSDIRNINDVATTLSDAGLEKSVNKLHEDDVYRQADDVLCFLNSWTNAVNGEPSAATFLTNGNAPLMNSAPRANRAFEEDEETKEFQASVDCSIMTELDQAIERLTATRTPQNKASPAGSHASARTTNGSVNIEGSMTPWEDISRKLTAAFSDQVNRNVPTCTKVPPPVQDRVRVTVSTALKYTEQKPTISFSSFQSSCKPMAPIQVLRQSQKDAEGGRVTAAATDKRNQWMFLAREDSFNRPDSPLFRKTLPLPKDSVIMRYRLHQKELGCSGGGGAGSLSSSESSEDESPVPRVAPRRTKKSRSMSVDKGVVGIEEATEEDDEKNGEGDSLVSSTTSLRPLSLDSSFLSEDNM